MTLRMSEVYLSTQGEGPRVGLPTIFVRFAGCNLRCPGWPCDTQYAIDPAKYRHEWKFQNVSEVAADISRLLHPDRRTVICWTGGEPFLQHHEDLRELFAYFSPYVPVTEHSRLVRQNEAFTNGTIPYPVWAIQNISMVLDWKLPGSGEDPTDPIRIQNLIRMADVSLGQMSHSVKFVIKDRADFDRAVEIWHQWKELLSHFQIYYGKAWGHIEDAQLVEWVLDAGLPWILNVQTHNYIWPRDERAR